MYTIKKNSKSGNNLKFPFTPKVKEKEKYIKKNYMTSTKKNKYKITSFKDVKKLPILEDNNFTEIFSIFDIIYKEEKNNTEKIEILEDGSVYIKNTKNTTRIPSPSHINDKYFGINNNQDINNNSNLLIFDNIKNDEEFDNDNNIKYPTERNINNNNNYIKKEDIYSSGMKINKSLPNIRKYYLTAEKEKENSRNKNIYIPHKPYNSGIKKKKSIKNEIKENRFIKEIEKKNNNNRLNYKRALFKDEAKEEYDDTINQWIYLVNKYIKMYNKKMLAANIQIITQNLKIQKILKNKINNIKPTNLSYIINKPSENMNEINQKFFDEIEKKDKLNKYKGGIESINEEINESNEEVDLNKDKKNILYTSISLKNKDFIFSKTKIKSSILAIKTEKKNNNNLKCVKLIFNGNKAKYNINYNSYKKIVKMAYGNKEKIKNELNKEEYESLISNMINNFICLQKKYSLKKNKENKNNCKDREKLCYEITLKIFDLERNIKELKNTYIYGLYNIQFIKNEKDKYNFIRNLNLTIKKDELEKIYKTIINVLYNEINDPDINLNYHDKIIKLIKNYEKIDENEINNVKNTLKQIKDYKTIINGFIIFLPFIFILNYFISNLKKYNIY